MLLLFFIKIITLQRNYPMLYTVNVYKRVANDYFTTFCMLKRIII